MVAWAVRPGSDIHATLCRVTWLCSPCELWNLSLSVCCSLWFCHARGCSLFYFVLTSTVFCIKNLFPQTVIQEFYCDVLRHFKEDIWQKWPDLWSTKNWILHDDNVPMPQVQRTSQKQHFITSAPTLFTIFSTCGLPSFLKMWLKGSCFNTIAKIQSELQKVLD